MNLPSDISPSIIEALYKEALELAAMVREGFDLSVAGREDGEDLVRIAVACEGLRCTTRMMHALAWLLNQRAYIKGEISEFQLRRHGRLGTRHPGAPYEQLASLPSNMLLISAATERFYARVERLDAVWRAHFTMQPPAIERLRQRLEGAIAAL